MIGECRVTQSADERDVEVTGGGLKKGKEESTKALIGKKNRFKVRAGIFCTVLLTLGYFLSKFLKFRVLLSPFPNLTKPQIINSFSELLFLRECDLETEV